MTEESNWLVRILADLTLKEKVALVSGADFWTTTPIERVGLRAMVLSDGPSGVRGPRWDERSPSLNLPSGTALAAAWDVDLAYAYGAVAAAEARRKGVDVVLGPTVNLHRSPLGGRHFEAFSEDPLLTGELAAAYVRGLQDNGVAATPKHYVANDSETDRFSVNVEVDERTLREIYLLPFELATASRPWAIMSAYNSVGGVTMSENDLLKDPLKTEWGFDGVVVSDWFAVRSTDAASAEQDLAMPGPAQAWSETLLQAIVDGVVAEHSLDRKVLRILHLAARVGALGTSNVTPIAIDGREFARRAAVEGAVLLANRDELPWSAEALRSVAVIGQNARDTRTQGGGSATVIPAHVISPLDGIRAALPHAAVSFDLGAIVHDGVAELPLGSTLNPITGETGVRVTFVSAEGSSLLEEDRKSSALVWFAADAPLTESRWIIIETQLTPDADGDLQLGFAASKHGRIFVDDVLLIDEAPELGGGDPGAALLDPPSVTKSVVSHAGIPLRIRAEFDMQAASADDVAGAAAITVGLAPQPSDPDELIERAVESARAADVAVVVVGTNSDVESEGYDRTSLDLPGRQDDLVRAVAAANPRTIVIVNSGSPVLLPWRNDIAAIVMGFFGGQEFGAAIADVVFGAAEPGGRLTTTWPSAVADVPVLDVVPTDGVLDYAEGVHVGYRAWLRHGIQPAYPFGWGLGYTTWELAQPAVRGSLASDDLSLLLTARNTGERAGKQVIQVYAERPGSSVDRPVRWLIGSCVVRLGPGDTAPVDIPLPARRFMHWVGERDGGWQLESGEFTLRVGTSVMDLPLSVTTTTTA
jgi:beta-glucosidase